MDTDVELIKSLDLLLNNVCYFPTQQIDKMVTTGLGFGAEKHQKIIKEMLEMYNNIIFDKDNLDAIICPIINTNAFKKYGYKFSEKIQTISDVKTTIYPPKYFDPISPGLTSNLIDDDTFSIHHYSASWSSFKHKFKRKLFRRIGQKNINKIKKILKR